ncbi:hypothetical protein QIW49_05405 [Francisellaceae bacterium CB300]
MIGDISIIGFSTMGISEFYGETNTNEAIDDIAHYLLMAGDILKQKWKLMSLNKVKTF